MRSNKQIFLLSLIVMQFFALASINTISGVVIAELYVDPYSTAATVGETFNVSIRIEGVVDLYAWQIAMSFNREVLEVKNATIGDFLATQPQGTFSPTPVLNNTHGWVGVGETTLGKYPGVDGSGWLATITFYVKADGESFLNITDPVPVVIPTANATCELLDSTWPESIDIPFTTEDGFFFIGAKPMASFTYSPLSPEENQPITFDASDSYDPDGSIIEYEWDFGDESNGTGVIVEHAFTVGGTFSVTLTVTDDSPHELQDTLTKDVSVRFGLNIAVASVTPSLTRVKVGEDVSITVSVTNEGTSVESFDVTIFYGDDVAGELTFTDVDPGATETLTYDWDTSQVDPATYRIKAVADTLEGEVDISDNTYTDGTVTVEAPEGGFPLEYVAVGAVAVIVVVVAVFLYARRRSSGSA